MKSLLFWKHHFLTQILKKMALVIPVMVESSGLWWILLQVIDSNLEESEMKTGRGQRNSFQLSSRKVISIWLDFHLLLFQSHESFFQNLRRKRELLKSSSTSALFYSEDNVPRKVCIRSDVLFHFKIYVLETFFMLLIAFKQF